MKNKKNNLWNYELSEEPKWRDNAQRTYNQFFDAADKLKSIGEDTILEILKDCVDLHVHAVPFETDFYWDKDEILRRYTDMGMGAVVFKGHSTPTYTTVYYAQKLADEYARSIDKIPTKGFGGVTLNSIQGGLSPETVEWCAKFGGKVVWLPTYDNAHFRSLVGREGGIRLLDDNDKPVKELYEIFKIIAENNMILDTSHSGTKERFVIISEAIKNGVKNITITHPSLNITKATIEQMVEWGKMGAFVGMFLFEIIPNYNNILCDPNDMFQILKLVGPDHIFFATDLGTVANMPPWEGYKLFIRIMLLNNISKSIIKKICCDNPSRLLGI